MSNNVRQTVADATFPVQLSQNASMTQIPRAVGTSTWQAISGREFNLAFQAESMSINSQCMGQVLVADANSNASQFILYHLKEKHGVLGISTKPTFLSSLIFNCAQSCELGTAPDRL